MRFFFYGTLLDLDVRRAVLGPTRGNDRGAPAVLPGYVRRRARHGNYPVLVRRLGRWVAGEVFEDLSPREVFLIAHFEGKEYGPALRTVVDQESRGGRPAWTFLPIRHADVTAQAWHQRHWARKGKPRLLREISRWSRELNVGTLRAQDIPWPVRRRLAEISAGSEDRRMG